MKTSQPTPPVPGVYVLSVVSGFDIHLIVEPFAWYEIYGSSVREFRPLSSTEGFRQASPNDARKAYLALEFARKKGHVKTKTREDLGAETILGGTRKMALIADRQMTEGKHSAAINSYQIMADTVANALKMQGLSSNIITALTVAAAQYYELAGDMKSAAMYSRLAAEKCEPTAIDRGTLRAIKDRAEVFS